MDGYTLLSKFIEFGAWPGAVLIIAFWLIDPVCDLLVMLKNKIMNSKRTKITVGDRFSVETEEMQEMLGLQPKVERDSQAMRFMSPADSAPRPKMRPLKEKIMRSVREVDEAILNSWHNLETVASLAAEIPYPPVGIFGVIKIGEELKNRKILSEKEAEVLLKLFELYIRFNENPSEPVDVDSVNRYKEISLILADKIFKATKKQGT